MTPTLHTRLAGPDDMGFVFSTWMNSHVFAQPDRERARVRRCFRATYVDPILSERPRVVVLYSPEAPRTLHGHAVATNAGLLSWVYVAFDLRGSGYARQAITAVMSGYPDKIYVTSKWPFGGDRFVFRQRGAVAA